MQSTVTLLRPINDKCKQWVRDNIDTEGWQWLGGGLAIEWRYVDGIVEAMTNEGLVLDTDYLLIS